MKPVITIVIKLISLSLILGLGIWFLDHQGYLNASGTNDHTTKKWNSFYNFTKEQPVDIILLGNSHMYTGIEPENLSTSLGVNAFILASPGTNVADSYFSLKEAIKQSKPSLVVLETYGINDFNPFQLKASALSDQFKSFSARKDFKVKLASTPFLFSHDNFLAAWSTTIRNHDYIFTNYEQIKSNIKLINHPLAPDKDLELGRYVRFSSGLTDATLAKYKKDGAPVDGRDYVYSEHAAAYVDKIVELCKENDIELIFLTLPMYHEHIKNYPVWRDRLGEILKKYPNHWVNMQDRSETNYSVDCFEDTYNLNQHMTAYGSIVAASELAEFIKQHFDNKLPDRKHNAKWLTTFYGKAGFFENNSPTSAGRSHQLMASDWKVRNAKINELLLVDNGNDTKTLLAKLDRAMFIHPEKTLVQVAINYIEKGERRSTVVELDYDNIHDLTDQAIFSRAIRPVEIESLVDGLVKNK